MSKVYFISDLHLGHRGILKFVSRGDVKTIEEHDDWIISQWNSVIKKRDIVWVLGDVSFGKKHLYKVGKLNGQKNLVRGNHDTLSTITYLNYFVNVYGLVKKYGYWLSHAPIHPLELRGHKNIHGHVHEKTIPDSSYINVCVDVLDGIPMSLEDQSRTN